MKLFGFFLGFLISFSSVSAAASETPESIVQNLQSNISRVFSSINECGPVVMFEPSSEQDMIRDMIGPTTRGTCIDQHLNAGLYQICEAQSRLLQMEMEIPEYSYELERVEEAVDEVLDIAKDYRDRLFDMAASISQHQHEQAAYYENIFIQTAAQECGA